MRSERSLGPDHVGPDRPWKVLWVSLNKGSIGEFELSGVISSCFKELCNRTRTISIY